MRKFISGLILGAGASSRFGAPKQLLPFKGATLLGWVINQAERATALDEVVVVLGRAAEEIHEKVVLSGVKIVENPVFSEGCSSSYRAGIGALDPRSDALMTEMGLVGNDGVVGIALFLGGNTVRNRAVVQVAGDAFRVQAPVIQEEFKRGGPCQLLLLRYTQALITQISQTAVCTACTPSPAHARPGRISRIVAHPGVHPQYAWRAPRECHEGSETSASSPPRPWPHHDPRS